MFVFDQPFWNTLWLLLILVPLLLLWAFVIFDIFRRDDLGGLARALWILAVFLAPLFGSLVYLIVRPRGATSQEREAMRQAERLAAERHATSEADQLRILAQLHDAGKLSDSEFTTEKAKVLHHPVGHPA